VSRLILTLALLSLLACGKTGPLRPPAPRGPFPPADVQARQLGDGVEVAFSLPKPRGDAKSQALGRAEVLRVAYPRGVPPPTDPDAFRLRGEIVAQLDLTAAGVARRLVLPDTGLGSLADKGIGWTLRYGVRVKDQKGRSSPLVVAHDLETVGPKPPPGEIRAEATADGIRLSWNAPDGVDEPRFNVYRGPYAGMLSERPLNLQPLEGTDYLDTTATVGERYRYVVRTVAAEGPPYRESGSSPVADVDASDRFAPAPPAGLVVVQEGKAVRLLWNPGAEPDLDGYRVYRRLPDGSWAALSTDVVRQPSYLDAAVTPGETFVYRVTAVDRASPAPNESGPSEEASIQVGNEP
jgi:predicted small lipoprotein YifL